MGSVLSLWTWVRTYVTEGLRMMGLIAQPECVYQEVEGQFVGALPRVAARPDFRQELASNLALVAQHKSSGMVVSQPHPYVPGVLVGVAAGALATSAAIVVLVLRSRIERRVSV